ncbi:precorrin-2 C(20)-methyltransferase [Hahella sp. KA22]|uniref:precorrin-2 C(20)-methyltransferase n=1 Tax=Hahella sp. KA22 TaxID=1628392 RepID=UPI000FDD1368|nr:precorrin-2 C(20)-methyltransferase [Hahella sp. KA22]AZZ94906.1 precorrin-2 C(20)-methyltransferase [Hahella sp. KA22]QAY52550.1 precorrin-2 C(20)-methyltransferase [Hahella sp. KA22]
MTTPISTGVFFGVGVGPGDPELLTLKAVRRLQQADALAYIVNSDGHSLAKQIASPHLRTEAQTQLPIRIEMCSDRRQAEQAYDEAAASIARLLDQGQDLAFLCEGDPLFYGSFAYLLARLAPKYPCVAIPGISSPQAASAVTLLPLALQHENLAVISARCPDAELLDALSRFDNLAILKGGRKRSRVLELIAATGRTRDAVYLEHLTQTQQRVVRDVTTLDDEPGPYFSLFLVCRRKGTS